jgi:YggT family protein
MARVMRVGQTQRRLMAADRDFLDHADDGIHRHLLTGDDARVPQACPAVNRQRCVRRLRSPARPHNSSSNRKERPMGMIYDLLTICLSILQFFILAQVVMSWLISFQVLNIRQPLVSQIWYGMNQLLEPVYRPVRQFLPRMSGIDLAPLAVLIIVFVARNALIRNQGFFYGY